MARFDTTRGRGGFGRFGGRIAVLVVALGLLAIGLGWNGVASNHILQRQMPYAISGIGVGLAFVVIGSALFILQGYREERAKLEAKLDEVIVALGGRPAASSFSATATAPADLAGLVVAGTASYHRPGCRLVDGREQVEYLTPSEAESRFLQPCRVCKPEPSNASVR